MKKESKVRGLPKNWIIEQYENNRDLTEEMKEKKTEFLLKHKLRLEIIFCGS